MERAYLEEETFEKIDFTEKPLAKGEYENCTFVYCNFTNADLSNLHFTECEFLDCNLSLAKLNKTALRGVKFKGSKLVGLHFETCNDFLISLAFDACILTLASFYKLKLKKTTFKNCTLHEVDFTETDLSGSLFETCDLARATFENTGLEKVDFRTSYNYSIDPELNRIKKARFSSIGIAGLLDKYDLEIE